MSAQVLYSWHFAPGRSMLISMMICGGQAAALPLRRDNRVQGSRKLHGFDQRRIVGVCLRAIDALRSGQRKLPGEVSTTQLRNRGLSENIRLKSSDLSVRLVTASGVGRLA
jgi:hypothetical protein